MTIKQKPFYESIDFITSGQLTGANNKNFPSTLAVKTYIDQLAGSGANNSNVVYQNVATQSALQDNINNIGTTARILEIPDSIDITSSLIIPENISLRYVGNGKFNVLINKTLTILNGIGLQAASDRQIFSGEGKVLFTKTYPSTYYLEWFGGKSDNVTDNLASWNKMQDSMANSNANLIYNRKGGGSVELALGGTYYFSDTVRIRRGMHIYANGGDRFVAGSGFRFPANKAGVRVEGISTIDGTFNDASQAGAWTRLENFSIISSGTPTNNCIVDLASNFVLTLKSGGQFTQASTRGQGSAAAMIPGSTVAINGSIYTVPAGFGSDPTATIPLEKPRFSVTTYGLSNIFYLNGPYASADWLGSTIRLNNIIYTVIEIINQSQIRINQTINDSGIGEMQTITAKTNQPARLNIYHGVIGLGTFDAKGIRIYGFAGNGLNLNSELYPTALLGNDPNVDLATFSNLSIEYSQGSGITVFGVNSQPMNFSGINNVENSRGWGFFEEGSSGVLLNSFHFNENAQGTYRIAGQVAHDVAIMPYTEGGQPGAIVGGNSLVINPIEGAATGVDAIAGSNNVLEGRNGQIHSRSGWLFTRSIGNFAATSNPKSFLFQIGNSQAGGVLLGFGGGEEAANAGNSPVNDPRVPAWILAYDQYKPGHYTLGFNNNGSSLTSAGNAALELSGSMSDDGGGNIFFPRGFSVGKFYSGTERTWNYVSSIPTTGTVRLGDIFWNNGTNVGTSSPIGWIASTAGTIGSTAVLTPFGINSNSALTIKSASYTVTTSDKIILVDSTSASRTITLLNTSSVTTGKEYIIKDWKGTAATNNIVINTTSSQTIDGTTTKTINVAYGVLKVVNDGINWSVL